MKKKTLIAALTAALLLTGCSGGNTSSAGSGASSTQSEAETIKTAAEKADALLSAVEFSGEMVAVDNESMEFRMGFGSDVLTDYAAYICGSGAFPDEFGIFTADTEEHAAEIKTALEKRIDAQKSTYQDYTPEEMYKFDDCFVKQNGTTVVYAVTADNTTAADILG
ncbi:MAG: DUF4358 domain-containing protein [Oscillospiraceae bacterium]